MRKRNSIFFNLPLKLIFYTFIIGVFMYGAIDLLLNKEYEERTEERINSISSTLDWAIDPLLEEKNYIALNRFVEKVRVNPFIENIRVYDNEYKIIASNKESEKHKALNSELIKKVVLQEKLFYKNKDWKKDLFEVALPIKGRGFSSDNNDRFNGTLYLKFNLKRERFIYSKIKYFLLIFTMTFLTLLSAVTMSILKKEILNPLAKVKEGLQKVSRGDYSYKIMHRGRMEINEIVKFFNEMSGKVREASKTADENTREAERISLVKSIFLANMTHELRTPLNLIIGYTELLVEEEKDSEKSAKMNTIVSAGKHLLVIINDILDLSKIEVDKLKLSPEIFSFSHMLENIKKIFNMRSDEKKVAFKISCDNNIPEYLFGDESRIKQIIINLLSNSFKFTDKGYVELKFKYQKSFLIITVKDTGIGIPPDSLKKIFNSFEQVEMNHDRKYEGTGLGLSITKELAIMMNGDISVKSEQGQGSEFLVKLKLPVSEKPKDNASDDLVKVDESQSDIGLEILLAEDIEDNRILVKHMLRKIKEVHVDFAVNGKEALEKISEKKYDLLLLDIQMPVMNGMEVLKNLKERDKLEDIHIIATTAYAMREEREKILESGSHDIITKPINMAKLRKKVRELLDKKRERKYGF
ncbi:ATP-binding protein [uncultured Ilyobacter sp.]|uniref:ATP-binding protein n=1 Tax=uncultured Ilyobacter sp. TaxID=544433 RepID=UPI002AA6A055|nr:ATP-binding protein [uncultured Ilyobacter sp.]